MSEALTALKVTSAQRSEVAERARKEVRRTYRITAALLYLCVLVATGLLVVLADDLDAAAAGTTSEYGPLAPSLRGFLVIIVLPALTYEALRRFVTPVGHPVLALIEALKLPDDASARTARRHYAAAEAALRVTPPSGRYRTQLGRRWQLEGIARAADDVARLEFDLQPGAIARNRPVLVRVLMQLVLDLWPEDVVLEPSTPAGPTSRSFLRSVAGRLLALALAIAALTPLADYGSSVAGWLVGK